MKILRGVLAIVFGFLIGGFINMGIIVFGTQLIPPPEGVDPTNMESLRTSMHLFKPVNFLVPFLAHALGTLAGAVIASLLAVSGRFWFALAIGLFFLLGGIVNAYLLPAPLWFEAVDILLAYIPMALLGWKIVDREK